MGQGFDLGPKPKMDATPITPSQVGNKPRKLLFITMNVLSSQVDGDFDLVKKLRGGTPPCKSTIQLPWSIMDLTMEIYFNFRILREATMFLLLVYCKVLKRPKQF